MAHSISDCAVFKKLRPELTKKGANPYPNSVNLITTLILVLKLGIQMICFETKRRALVINLTIRCYPLFLRAEISFYLNHSALLDLCLSILLRFSHFHRVKYYDGCVLFNLQFKMSKMISPFELKKWLPPHLHGF